ncbi:MAG: FAD-binding oxidoreductase [Myxococcales bacterium]|nr:FAD-binding oxidoreductase [Myxococcales bacterium]
MSAGRSHWGWGWADRFPDLAGQRALGAQLQAVLGYAPSEPTRPVPLEAVTLPAPRLAVPADCAPFTTTARDARVRHAHGRSFPDQWQGFHGQFAAPDAVATPRDEADLDRLFGWAARTGAALIPFGGGTSVVGGVTRPRDDRPVITVSLAAFDQVLEVEPVSRLVRAQAGLFGPALEAALAPHGLTLRHFPQSFEFSTVGGWLATRAGGHFATRYTHIDDLTASIRMLTPARGVWESRCLPGSGAGPSPDRLVLGSEGALGIITEGWLRVRPRPRWRASATVTFRAFEDAVAATRAVAQAGLSPSNCRLLDAREAALNMVALDGSTVLLLGFESADHPVQAGMARALEIVADQGGTLPRPPTFKDAGAKGRDAQAGAWRQAFLDGPYLQSTLLSLGVIADTFETACTWAGFPALHAAVIDAVRGAMKAHCGRGRIGCRFTHVYPDGPAPYYTWIAPADRPRALAQWAAVKAAASEALLAHGGTITHHHAVGRIHREPWARQRPAPFGAALAAVKGVLDPQNLMNPGALVDEPLH